MKSTGALPILSIGMPVYNGEATLREAIDSLLAQDFRDFELIVCDDQSKDQSLPLLESYAKRDSRVRVIRNPVNLGMVGNYNRTFELAQGQYFMWADQDDVWAPHFVSACLELHETHGDALVISTTQTESVSPQRDRVYFIDPGLNTISLSPSQRYRAYIRDIRSGHNIGGLFCGIYRRSVLRTYFPFPNIIGWDHVVLARLTLDGAFACVPQVLFTKRWGGTSSSYAQLARIHGIQSRWIFLSPLFPRECLIQRAIFQSTLSAPSKITLSLWSWMYFIWSNHAVPFFWWSAVRVKHLIFGKRFSFLSR